MNDPDIWPVMNEAAVRKQEEHVAGTLSHGARRQAGGERHPAGPLFWRPTVLAGVPDTAANMREETFGPADADQRQADLASRQHPRPAGHDDGLQPLRHRARHHHHRQGLSSAYAPLSGSILSDGVWKVLEQGTDEMGPIGHGWTYSAHPIGAAAGVANLELLDRLDLVTNARETGAHFNRALAEAVGEHPNVGEVRGEGMPAAVEFVADREARVFFDPAEKVGPRVAAALLAEGVIGRAMPQGDILGFAPPLCLKRAEAEEVAQKTARAVRAVLG